MFSRNRWNSLPETFALTASSIGWSFANLVAAPASVPAVYIKSPFQLARKNLSTSSVRGM
jgi:hypothetical protein